MVTLRIIDIIGVALILGLLLRYGQEASMLIGSGTNAFAGAYQNVALWGAPAPPIRAA